MPDEESPQRKRLRLSGYDYANSGVYFITVCVKNRLRLFGRVESQVMKCSAAGQMVEYWWQEIAHKYAGIQIMDYVIMPNHVHGLLHLHDGTSTVPSIPDALRWFKSMTTNAYIQGVNRLGWFPFAGSLWQRSYYDHIIRNETDYHRICEYILHNPSRWDEDSLYTSDS